MQAPKRLSIKIFAQNPQVADADAFVPIFQRWIQEHSVEGLLIDVADYKHVPNGVGILLIGHEGDYAYDYNNGLEGVQYTLKQVGELSLVDALRLVVNRVQSAAQQLQNEAALKGLRFNLATAQVAFLDRLNYPNNAATLEKLQRELGAEFNFELSPVSDDPREALTLTLAFENITA